MKQHTISVKVPAELRATLELEAKAEGVSLAAHGGRVLGAALSVRCRDERAEGGKSVAGVLVLTGLDLDREAIARTLGLDVTTVDRILAAWRGRLDQAAA